MEEMCRFSTRWERQCSGECKPTVLVRSKASAGWIHLVAANGQGDGVIPFTVEANPQTSSRGGAIEVSNAGQIAVTQAAQPPAPPPAAPAPGPSPGPTPPSPPTPPEDSARKIEIKGEISFLVGRCPDLSFMLDGRIVRTDANTDFKGLKCTDLRNGRNVRVRSRATMAPSWPRGFVGLTLPLRACCCWEGQPRTHRPRKHRGSRSQMCCRSCSPTRRFHGDLPRTRQPLKRPAPPSGALLVSLTSQPVASSSSGFSYRFNLTLGTFERASDSLVHSCRARADDGARPGGDRREPPIREVRHA
jgi:hypothetical protein